MFGELTHGTDGNDDIRENIVIYAKNAALFFVAFLLLYYSVRRLIPEDLFSSALYYDSLGLQKVFAQPAMLVDDPLSVFIMTAVMGFSFPSVSAAAFSVGFMLFLVQIWCGYKASVSGGYTNKSETLLSFVSNIWNNTDKLDPKTLNWGKVNWLLAWVLIAFADTFTDISYRSGGSTSLLLESLFISVLVYNILSEWAMLTGLIGVLNYGYVVIVDTIPVVYHSVSLVIDEINKVRNNIATGSVPAPMNISKNPSQGNRNNQQSKRNESKHNKGRQGSSEATPPTHRESRPNNMRRSPMSGLEDGTYPNVTITDRNNRD